MDARFAGIRYSWLTPTTCNALQRLTSLGPVVQNLEASARLGSTMFNQHKTDVEATHWELNREDSLQLLEFLFPDERILRKRGELEESPGAFTMLQVLGFLEDVGMYGVPPGPLLQSSRNTQTDWKSGVWPYGMVQGQASNMSEVNVKVASTLQEPTKSWLSNSRCPDLRAASSKKPGSALARFFNSVLQSVKVACGFEFLAWSTDSPLMPPGECGLDFDRKFDLTLFEPNGKSWQYLVSFCEVKKEVDALTERDSYMELARKSACLLFMQDGRHAAPSFHILGSLIYFTVFDRGGSISTCGFDIHHSPEVLLRILIGLSCYRHKPEILGADTTMTWLDWETHEIVTPGKALRISTRVGSQYVFIQMRLTKILFISDTLLGRGTTVWRGEMIDHYAMPMHAQVAVKDAWIDPLRKYTEGAMLRILNKAGIEGIPTLIYDGQVTPGPSDKHDGQAITNHSTHCIRAGLKQYASGVGAYDLRVLYRLVTEPVGSLVTDFRCLAELLVAFLDFVVAHKDALEKAHVLHRDISLMNLLLVSIKSKRSDHRSMMGHLSLELRDTLCSRIAGLERRGLLADWGYAVPTAGPLSPSTNTIPVVPGPLPSSTTPLSPGADSDFLSNATSPHVERGANPTTMSSAVSLTSSAAVDIIRESPSGHPEVPTADNCVFAQLIGSTAGPKLTPIAELSLDHNIVVTGNPLEDKRTTDDTNPLCRTGTWPWMSCELAIAGPNEPVIHNELHDLESFFYVLVGMTVLYDEPGKIKPDKELEKCFDQIFNASGSGTLKTVTIQSAFGWSACIVEYISPYFRPLLPLLNNLRREIIMPLRACSKGRFVRDVIFSHDMVIKYIVSALSELPDESWVPDPPLDGQEDKVVRPVSEQDDDSMSVDDPVSVVVDGEHGDTSPSELRQKRPAPSSDGPPAKRRRSL